MPNFTQSATCLFMSFAAASAVNGQSLILEKHVVRDSTAMNHEALTLLKPHGWKVTGGIKWYPNFTHQACVELKVTEPRGIEQVETLPWCYATWITNPIIPMQTGTNYLGNIILPPIDDPAELVRTVTIPQVRPGARYIGATEMPELAETLSRLAGSRVRSARIRIEYTVNGFAVEEDLYVSLFRVSSPLGVNNAVSTVWGPAWSPFAIRAAKGQLDAQTPMLLSIVNSAKLNPQWFAEYSGVCQLFQLRMANDIENARRLSETITRNSREISDMYSDAYWKRQASQDRMAQNFSDSIRGIQRYESPHETYPVQLPGGFRNAWAGSDGTYFMSNQEGFDPNVGSTTSWTLMNAAR